MTDTPVDLTTRETGLVLRDVLGPLVAQGAIVRRPRATAWAERRQVDRTARRLLDRLRSRYHGAPLVVRLGARRLVLATRPEHVERILVGSPAPFTPASWEKRGALGHFQPDGVLISPPEARRERRPENEAVLDTSEPVHHDGDALVAAVEREARDLVATVEASGRLDWDTFAASWWRVVRTVVLGRAARDDERLVAVLDALRRDGNWSWFRPRRPWLRAALERRIAEHVAVAEPGTLAARGRDRDGADAVRRQIPHWLFAFDAAGAATFRALAVASARPVVRERLLAEPVTTGRGPAVLPYARGCVLESVRLWPTTLAILRDATAPVRWGARTFPAGTGFVVLSAYFHRDPGRLSFADAFTPEAWLDGRADADWGLVPFSGGPVSCPGRNVVLLLASHTLVRVARLDLVVGRGRYLARDPLPPTMDHLGLRFGLRGETAPGEAVAPTPTPAPAVA
ncbi:cytochrome P450 [Cellulosimicrobium sp. CpK407]|uniref:cytochrome P450 n=1 Tax=Cellulosimicrobium sp. CpK407 TaxID=3229847 RepID=UPI003F3574C9